MFRIYDLWLNFQNYCLKVYNRFTVSQFWHFFAQNIFFWRPALDSSWFFTYWELLSMWIKNKLCEKLIGQMFPNESQLLVFFSKFSCAKTMKIQCGCINKYQRVYPCVAGSSAGVRALISIFKYKSPEPEPIT